MADGTMSDVTSFAPAQRAIDFANAVRRDPGLPREDLAGLLRQHGESPADLTEQAFTTDHARTLRTAVNRLIPVLTETEIDRAAGALNELLEQYTTRPWLSRHDGHAWHLHVDRGDDAGWDEWFLSSSSLALAQLLADRGRIAWGECAAEACGTLFLDAGPGSARRYCSPACSSRARVAAHRRRRADGTA